MTEISQKILPLEGEEAAKLEERRAWVYGYPKRSSYDFSTTKQKLDLVGAIVDSGLIKAQDKWPLRSLGVVFGDALAQQLDLVWVLVDDEHGRDPALMVPKTTILVFPLTAISKRVEDGESIDVHELFAGFCELIEKRRPMGTIRN